MTSKFLLRPHHKRFEHSLGVMELATNIFDVVMDDDNLTKRSREVFQEQLQDKQYWRQTLRMAALCHDVGHLPFWSRSNGLFIARFISYWSALWIGG